MGPVIDPAGLDRIRPYVGQLPPVSTCAQAAAQVHEMNASVFPDYGEADWLALARNGYRENEDGMPVPAYDPAVSESLRRNNLTVDL